jgi:hypothetical protein
MKALISNNDELPFARALDRLTDAVWLRNPATAAQGYGIPLPRKVGDSTTFTRTSLCGSAIRVGRSTRPDVTLWTKKCVGN